VAQFILDGKKMFSKFTIKARLIGTMVLMAIMLVSVAAMGTFGLQTTNDALKGVYSNQLASSIAISEAQARLLQARTVLDRVILRIDDPKIEEMVKRAEEFHEQSEKAWQRYLALPADSVEKKLSDDVAAKRVIYLKEGGQALIMAIRNKQRADAERLLFEKVQPLFTSLNTSAEELSNLQMKNAAQGFEASQSLFSSIRTMTIVGTLLGLLIVVTSAFFLIRAITHPLQEALDHFDAISAGDLTRRIEAKSSDEMGRLMMALSKMHQSLTTIIGQVRTGTDTIATASSQIAAGNQDLSSRTEEQASSLEETASAMEELTSTVKQNADNARQANQLAVTAADIAAKGGSVVGHVVDTMASINESSKKIVDIIAVIDGIAFQTNILALNAAVEAARAGEQGRGFAVVASEVRNLAQRSAGAAKEIKALINDSVAKVDDGTNLVNQAGATMEQIVDSIKRVTDIMGEIAAATQEQSAGIEQVNQAISQMDQVTQQNAALVEEAAAASEAMQDQAGKLAKAVSVFKLETLQTVTLAKVPRPAFSAVGKKVLPPASAISAPRSKRLELQLASKEWEQF
jgi:methyl-accepting chemotaxis protein-1 (serine sensor receptor)